MKKNMFIIISLFSAITACSNEDTASENITNKGLWADMEVTESGDNVAKVLVELNAGGNNGTNLILSDGEYLEAFANSSNTTLQKNEILLDIRYEGSLEVENEDTVFTINFYRNEQEDALNSKVTLPMAFAITSPQVGDILYKDQIISVQWDSARVNEIVELRTSLNCKKENGELTSNYQFYYPDDIGEYSIDLASSLVNGIDDADPEQLCDMNIKISREVNGSLSDQIQDGGKVTAVRSRMLKDILVDISD